jgi:hypothetical protein
MYYKIFTKTFFFNKIIVSEFVFIFEFIYCITYLYYNTSVNKIVVSESLYY